MRTPVLEYRDEHQRWIRWSPDARQAAEPDPDGTVPVFVFWRCEIQQGACSGYGLDRDPTDAYHKALLHLNAVTKGSPG